MSNKTTYLYARPGIWCRLFGHNFRLAFTERTYGSPFNATPVATVRYKECRCCNTRMAQITNAQWARSIDFDWLREKFDASKK